MNNFMQQLNTIKKESISKLEKAVIEEIFNNISTNEDADIEGFIRDLGHNGCQSGMVNSLIYHTDIYKFFDQHSEEIFNILDEIKDNTGEEFSNYKGNRKNTLAWLGFEETVIKIAEKLNIEL